MGNPRTTHTHTSNRLNLNHDKSQSDQRKEPKKNTITKLFFLSWFVDDCRLVAVEERFQETLAAKKIEI